MSTYAVSDFSFNIGTTNISQQYVPLVKQDVPWGINSTYIYKAPTLATQFNVNNKHLVIENQCLSGNIVFKTQDSGRIIINDLSVGTINGVPYSGIGSGVGVGLTANSVNSSHIIDGSILGTDISEGTITTSNIANNTITKEKLQGNCIVTSKIADGAVGLTKLTSGIQTILNNANRPLANLIIYNYSSSTAVLRYEIQLYDPLVGSITTYFMSAREISIGSTHNILINLPNISTQIEILVDTDDISIAYYAIEDGATEVGTIDTNKVSFTLNEGSNNIQVGFLVEPN